MNHTYKIVEIVGTSPDGITEAIQNGISRAAQTIQHLDWFEVVNMRGQIADGAIAFYQVDMKVGFRVLDAADLHKE